MININQLQVDDMIYTRDHQTEYLFDPWAYFGAKRRKLLDESWAGLFREHILLELPVHKIAPCFTEGFGRPTKELYTALGVLILQQMHDLTDEETVLQMAFNNLWHYALDIPDESDDAKYMSLKTLWTLRHIVMENNLDAILFNQTTETLARVFQVDTKKQRIDSVHIRSNMCRLGRIGIFSQSIHTFLINLRRQHKELFDTIEKELIDRYVAEKALNCFSLVKPSESEKTLEMVGRDLFSLVQRFRENPRVAALHSYNALLRVLKEQCHVTEGRDNQPPVLEVKPSREIPSDSLQNPSDPDAGYDGHKGQGYQVQVMETYCDSEDKEIREKTLNLITHVEIEPACVSDTHALIPALESAEERGLSPTEVLADSLYGSDDNCEKAKEMGTDVISPTLGTPKENTLSLSDFKQSEKGRIIACPQGHAPVKAKLKKNNYNMAFALEHCSICPLKDQCPVKPGKKNRYLRYDLKTLRIANRRAREYTPEFKDKYRWRSGIESSFSEMDKKTGVKRLRVRGLPAVSYCARLKAIGVNLYRATAVRKALYPSTEAFSAVKSAIHRVIYVFKERFLNQWVRCINIFELTVGKMAYELKTAA